MDVDGVVAGVIGAGITALGAYVLYLRQRRDTESTTRLASQRDAVLRQFRAVYSAKTWLEQSVLGCPPESETWTHEVQAEARERMQACHLDWDFAFLDVDSKDAQAAMTEVDNVVMQILADVSNGNMRPDIEPMRSGLTKLKAVANSRLGRFKLS